MTPEDVLTVAELEALAKARMDPAAFGYFEAGADDFGTLRENRAAFARRRLRPRVLVDVSNVDATTTLLGARVSSPVGVAPTAYHGLAAPEGERASARAAAAEGALFVVSTLATTRLEDVAAAAPAGLRWFQLYVQKDRGLTRSLVARAEAAGYRALCVTVDAPVLGRRLADLRSGFGLPPHLSRANLDESGVPQISAQFAESIDPSLSWRDLDALAAGTSLPLVLKGIVRADDARRAADAGVQGIVVSNHGGRQLDGAIASLDALPEVVEAAGRDTEILVDGGVRSGTDVLKALALGARGVLIGRPFLWGLAAFGEAGARRALALLREELLRAMALAGAPRLDAVTPDLVTAP